MTHELKTWPAPFQAIVDGTKRFEIRKNDRDFNVGDALRMREWEPRAHVDRTFDPQHIAADHPGTYTGREVWARITYMVPGGRWGLPNDLCVMSIAVEQLP